MPVPKNFITSDHDIFTILQSHPDDFSKISNQIRSVNIESQYLLKIFLHKKNIMIIQKKIIIGVFKATNNRYVIPQQNLDDLVAIMEMIYQKNIERLGHYDVQSKIKKLNELAVNEIVPHIIKELETYENYLRDIKNPMEFLDRPQYESNRGYAVIGK